MKPIHDRMPVILQQAENGGWSPRKYLEWFMGLMVPYESDDMKAYRVKELVNHEKQLQQNYWSPTKAITNILFQTSIREYKIFRY